MPNRVRIERQICLIPKAKIFQESMFCTDYTGQRPFIEVKVKNIRRDGSQGEIGKEGWSVNVVITGKRRTHRRNKISDFLAHCPKKLEIPLIYFTNNCDFYNKIVTLGQKFSFPGSRVKCWISKCFHVRFPWAMICDRRDYKTSPSGWSQLRGRNQLVSFSS